MKNEYCDHHIFLAGPWEKFVPEFQKSRIKATFRGELIYDPEDHEIDPGQSFIKRNFDNLLKAKIVVAYCCPIPMNGVSTEIGEFYAMKVFSGQIRAGDILENLILIWPPELSEQPKAQYGLENCKYLGRVVSSTDEAIFEIAKLLAK